MDAAPPLYEEDGNDGQTMKGLDAQPPEYSNPEGQIPTPSEPPPSYESIYERVKEAKLEAETKLQKMMTIMKETLGCVICSSIVLAIPVSMIVMGSVYYNDCPAERRIPMYLIVGGALSIIKIISCLCQLVLTYSEDDTEESNCKTTKCDLLMNKILFISFLAGNVFIYKTYGTFTSDKSTDPQNYCDQTLYDYAFWLTTSTYILFGTSCCCICLWGCLSKEDNSVTKGDYSKMTREDSVELKDLS